MAADLDTLLTADIPEGRQNLLDSFTNLERVAEYCENNYYQCDNKRAALEETKSYTTQSLASVAYQINTLAYNFLQSLDLQASQLGEMESQVNHITQTVGIHKEKVARREIGVLTTNKAVNRQYKIIAPATPERPIKYVRKPIDYSVLDTIGHGVRVVPQKQHLHIQQAPQQQQLRVSTSSVYGPGLMAAQGGSTYGSIGNVSNNSGAGPAPTTKPPTPPQASRYSTGTLNRSKEYRTPPVVAPPQVPSNYAPNYPMQQQQSQIYQKSVGKQYGTLPHPQVQMVHPVQQPNDIGSGATMPRLSSASMRSTSSHSSNDQPGSAATLGRPGILSHSNQPQMYRQSSATPPGSLSSRQGTPPSQYGVMTRPSQRPPSPPLPPPPMQQTATAPGQVSAQHQMLQQQKYIQQQQQQGIYGTRQSSVEQQGIYGTRQSSVEQQGIYGTRQNSVEQQGIYGTRQSSVEQKSIYGTRQSSIEQQQQNIYARQASEPTEAARPNMSNIAAAAAEALYARQLSNPPSNIYNKSQEQIPAPPSGPPMPTGAGQYGTRQMSTGPAILPANKGLPGWVPKNYLERVTAIYDYAADKDDELSFNESATIYVLKKNDDGWWEGVMDGITGLFPGNYVEATI